jgi:hypothetical protein
VRNIAYALADALRDPALRTEWFFDRINRISPFYLAIEKGKGYCICQTVRRAL